MHTCINIESMLKCQMVKRSNANAQCPMHKCSIAQMLKCTNAQMHKCANAQMLKCSNTKWQVLKCANARFANAKCTNLCFDRRQARVGTQFLEQLLLLQFGRAAFFLQFLLLDDLFDLKQNTTTNIGIWHLCICAFVHLCICTFVHLCIVNWY